MKTIYHSADSRGFADHGWLKSYHTFSFANYYDEERVHFGALRVLNDDYVAGGQGFGRHPHNNMEIISIPLEGDLEHGDSMGNTGVIKNGDIQVMSAGTGVVHSEMNANALEPVRFLQIWLFPRTQNVEPRYDQISIKEAAIKNDFQLVLSPNKDDEGVWIHQDAWFNIGDFEEGAIKEYQFNLKGNGIYIFVLEGEIEVEGKVLNRRDGLGVWETDVVTIKANKESKFLMMEVPMEW